MSSLLRRLVHPGPAGGAKISPLAFFALLRLYRRGLVNSNDAADALGLTASEKLELNNIITKVQNSQLDVDMIFDALLVAEALPEKFGLDWLTGLVK